jgi:hypothetical protein
MEIIMTKATDIDDVIAWRSPELMLDALWDDPAIVEKIKAKLEKVSAENMKYYHAYFCGSEVEETK